MLDMYQKLNSVTENISVLYVEDNKESREQYENIFKLLFKEVVSVQDGEVALKEFNKKRYDLLITDLTMPQMDGIALISEIFKINPNQHIIIMTAHNTNENLRDSIDFMLDGILLKPVIMDKLFHLLYKVCHLIYFENQDITTNMEDKKIKYLLESSEQSLFLVVVDKFNDIVEQFGSQIKSFIFDAVKEHLSYFGIEDTSTLQLHNDVIICGADKYYLDKILEALQDFSDSNNVLIVMFNNLKIYITLSYGVIILKQNSTVLNKSEDFLNHVNNIINEIKNDEHSTLVVKMDVDLEEAKRNNSLSWLEVTLDALKQEAIVPFYQQIVDINTMEIVSYEVFARIKQGEKYILPKFFIDLSEKAGILEDISKSIFKKSFKKFSMTNFSFHLNLGDSELRNNAIKEYLVYLSTQYKIDHSRIILDIMNYESFKLSGKTVKSLLELKKLGHKIALKGFAAGSINIELLSILQPEYIKIDQILLEKSLTDPIMRSSLSFLLNYTKTANIKSILVGVETEKILNEGKKLGFNYAQGYFIKRPSDKL